jgi:SAM-dependent methyltransferase
VANDSAALSYDTIGRTYTRTRQTDPRVAAQIAVALGDATSVLNVGAGAGSYEPPDRRVVALEPSATMIAQRPVGAGPAVRGAAEQLPFRSDAFEAAMGTLTLHHWRDLASGLAEVRRVSRRQVFLLFDHGVNQRYWLVEDYFPQLRDLASEAEAPTEADLARHLEVRQVEVVPVPADCLDGFGGAFWCRPEAHLDPDVVAGMSWTALLPREQLRAGLDALAADLASGAWDERHGHLRDLDELDLGYRLVIAGDA